MTKKEKELNRREIKLYETKFFDYRALSPNLATMRFLLYYAKSMIGYHSWYGNGKYFNVLKPFKSLKLEDLRQNLQFKQLANLRR